MKKANISKVKAELSKYLRYVKQGEEVVILDREQAVAKLVPVSNESSLRISEPTLDLKETIAGWGRQVFDQTDDIVRILAEDREDRL